MRKLVVKVNLIIDNREIAKLIRRSELKSQGIEMDKETGEIVKCENECDECYARFLNRRHD
jgi:hypothetical protein